VAAVGVVTTTVLSTPISHLMAGPALLGYTALAGLLQAFVSWFSLRRRVEEGPAHLTSLLAGAAAFALPFSIAVLASEISLSHLFAALISQLFFMFVGWFVLVILLVPVTWMARGRAAEGDLMSPERAMLVSGAILEPIFLALLRHEQGLFGFSLPASVHPLLRLLVGLLAALSLLAALRMVARTWWLARVDRGLVPGWRVARGEECARHAPLPSDHALSHVPRWDGLSDGPMDGVLVYAGSGESVESFRQTRVSPSCGQGFPTAYTA
jgi:hypothetical protein